MSFEIQYFDVKGEHIVLKADGSIELWANRTYGDNPIVIPYLRSRMLKKIIVAEYELERKG